MAQIVKLRRSSVSGQKPTNSNLQLGELALNTTDGKVFMAKSGSLGPSVEEILVTNASNTGSLTISGSVSILGNQSITGSLIVSDGVGYINTGLIAENSDLVLTSGSDIHVEDGGIVSASQIWGDGSHLINIPASGVTGLELYKIVSGSVSASISPDRGLEINTKTTITGSITLALTEDPDPTGLTTQATHLFVSASNNQTGEDLYIRQQDNLVKWKWLEGKLNTGILWGGALSYSGETIYITKGSGIIVEQRASAIQEISPITTYVNWNDITASCQHVTSSLATYVGIDENGSLYQQDNYFSVTQYRETIPLGMFNHTNKSTITSVANDVLTSYDDVNQTANFIQAFGPLKLDGLTLTPQSGNLQLTIGSGQSYIYGGFYQQDPNNSSHKITSIVTTPQIARVRRDGNGSFVVDNNNGAFYTTIGTSHWDDGTGTLNTVGGNYSIQRVFFNPFTTRVHVYYGQNTYGNKTLAIQGLSTDSFVEAEYSAHQYVFVGYIIVKGGTSDLTVTNDAQIVQAGLFRNTVGSSGGAQTLATLHDLSDVDIATEANGDLLSYSSTTGKWTHGKSLTGNYEITGSLIVTGALTGSIDFNNLTNAPTLVSGSSQINITGTTDYTTFSSSISTSIGELSSSVATTTSGLDSSIGSLSSSVATTTSDLSSSVGSLSSSVATTTSDLSSSIGSLSSSVATTTFNTENRLDSIEGVTGSYATTGSNVFIGDQTITGSLYVSNSLYIGSGTNDIVRIKALISSSLIPDSDGIHHFVGAQNRRWEAVYARTGSFEEIHGTLGSIVNIFHATVSGSFTGDGAGLYNIPASGVTGLQLDKIVNGNASASIDDSGLYVNRNVYIDGTLTAKELYIDYVTSSVVYQSGSTKFGDSADDNHNFTGSVYIDGNLNVDSITGSLNFSNLTDLPTLVSGSSQINITGTTDYTTFSSSIATTDYNQELRLNSIESFTSSYATGSFTGSFTGTLTGDASNNLRYIGVWTGTTHGYYFVNDVVKHNNSLYVCNNNVFGNTTPDLDSSFTLLSDTTPTGSFLTISSFENFTGSYTTGSFTGSFIGDGIGLYNIPASGVTGLQLDKIISGNASASIDNTGLYVNRDVYIDGSLTAKELHIDYVTSSILYQSGSTRFGDSADDTHTFTGSMFISNSLFVGGGVNDIVRIKALISSSLIPDSDGIHHFVGAQDRRWEAVYAKTGSFNQINGTYGSVVDIKNASVSGSFTGSFIGDATGLTNVPFHISGSDIFGTNVDKTFTKLQFDDSTGLNVEEVIPGTAFISIGSHFKDIFVSGSPILSATGSDAFEIIPAGGIEITTSTTDTNGNGYVKELNISATALSSSLNDRIDIITGSIDTLNTFTSSVVLTSETASMTVLSSSYALTASYALNAGGGAEGRTAKLTQSSAATTWTFDHNLGEQYPEVTVYDSLGYVVIPTSILAYNNNRLIITFSSAQSGVVTATVGGGMPAISASYAGYVLSNNGTSPTWKGGIVSGSLQVAEYGYATTGSNTFVGNEVINGTLTINNAKIGTVCATLPSTTTVLNLSTFDGANIDYVIKSSGNMRAGNIMGVWSGSSVKFTETSTMDIGDTSGFTFTISNNGSVTANFASGTWVVEMLYRAIGGCT